MTELAATRGEKLLYTAKTRTTGGRENGVSRSSDDRLDIKLSTAGFRAHRREPGAAACCRLVGLFRKRDRACRPQEKNRFAGRRRHRRRSGSESRTDGYFLSARLNISLPDVERDLAKALVEEAHQTCPYSKATRGNIEVAINLM